MRKNSVALFVFACMTATFAFAQGRSNQKAGIPERLISIDFSQQAGPLNTMFKECVGAGRANEGLRADWQQQLAYVKKECGFRYIRMHGLLTDDMAVYKEDKDGNPEYNFMYVDALFDSPVSTEIITVKGGIPFLKELDIRENDVVFLNFVKL